MEVDLEMGTDFSSFYPVLLYFFFLVKSGMCFFALDLTFCYISTQSPKKDTEISTNIENCLKLYFH